MLCISHIRYVSLFEIDETQEIEEEKMAVAKCCLDPRICARIFWCRRVFLVRDFVVVDDQVSTRAGDLCSVLVCIKC